MLLTKEPDRTMFAMCGQYNGVSRWRVGSWLIFLFNARFSSVFVAMFSYKQVLNRFQIHIGSQTKKKKNRSVAYVIWFTYFFSGPVIIIRGSVLYFVRLEILL